MERYDSNLVIKTAAKHAQHMNEICADFMRDYNISCFQHIRWFNNNKKIDLCTHMSLIDWYYTEALHQFSLTEIPTHCFENGYIFGDVFPKSSPIRIEFEHMNRAFDIAHDFFLLENFTDYSDFYVFSSPVDDSQPNHKYMRYYQNLKKFIEYYRAKAEDIFNRYEPFSVNSVVEVNLQYLSSLFDNYLVQADRRKKYNHTVDVEKVTLRELQTLYWLAKGKTSPEMAIIFGLSKRTVEYHIARIKYKLGCVNLFQVGRIIGEFKHHFQPLFYELESCGLTE